MVAKRSYMSKKGMISNATITIRLKQGFSQSDIAREFDVSRQAISSRLKYKEKPGHQTPAVRRFTVVFLRRLGFTLNEISNLTDYTETHVRQVLKMSGMPSSDMRYRHKTQKIGKKCEIILCIISIQNRLYDTRDCYYDWV